jgi:transposase
LSQWLHAGLKPAGFDAILLETRHVKRRCLAMTVKTDRNDARGLAQLMRMGWFRPVHAKLPQYARLVRRLRSQMRFLCKSAYAGFTYSECWSRTFGGYRVAHKASFEAKA